MTIDKNTKIYLRHTEIVKIKKGDVVIWEKSSGPEPTMDCFYIENISSDTGDFKFVKLKSPSNKPSMEYSIDGGSTWTGYNFSTLPTVEVSSGSKIYFRGNSFSNEIYSDTRGYKFDFNKSYNIGGNLMSISDFDTMNTIDTISESKFAAIFNGQTNLVSVSDLSLGNVTTINVGGFSQVFGSCSNLINGVDLSKIVNITTDSFLSLYALCKKLETVTAPNVQTWNTSCFSSWLFIAGVSGTKTAYVPAGVVIPESSNGVPNGWTRVEYSTNQV